MLRKSFLAKFILIGFSFVLCITQAAAHDELWNDAHSNWVFTAEQDGIVYLINHDDARIDRYDMDQSIWIDPLLPPSMPTALVVDSLGVVVATGRSLYSAAPGSTEFFFMGNTVGDVRSLATDGDTLHVSMSGDLNYEARSRISGLSLVRRDFNYHINSMVVSTTHNTVLGRTTGVSPSDIVAIDLKEPSDFLAMNDSQYHGAYPYATHLWLYPDQSRVIDNAGILYSVPELTWIGSAAGLIKSATFIGNDIYVLSATEVRRLDNRLLELGRRKVSENTEALFAHGDMLNAFSMEDGVATVTSFAAAEVVSSAAESIDITTAAFQADDVVVAADGSLLMLTKANNALFRYSPDLRQYTAAYALQDRPSYIASALHTDSVFIGYETGAITQLDLATGFERPFVNLSGEIGALISIENALFAHDPSGAWGSDYLIDLNGSIIASDEWRDPNPDQVWLGASREMLRYDSSNLIAQNISTDLNFGDERRSEYDIGPINNPLILSPDSSFVLTGAGSIYNTATFELEDTLATALYDAVWPSDGFLVSLTHPDSYYFYAFSVDDVPPVHVHDLRIWGERFQPIKAATFDATGAQLVQAGTKVMLVINDAGDKPRVLEITQGSDDLDSDGIPDAIDEFPLDPQLGTPVEINEVPGTESNPGPSTDEGYRFTRSDVNELRWVGSDASGIMGSEWIDQACFDSLSGPVESGDWHALIAQAPGANPVSNPCAAGTPVDTPIANSEPPDGFRFSRSDVDELRWVGPDENGVLGSMWIDQACFDRLTGDTLFGDWIDLVEVSPGGQPVLDPCNRPVETPTGSLTEDGYFFSRSDKNEYWWISEDANGVPGRVWVDAECWERSAASLEPTGDWNDLVLASSGGVPVVNPCFGLPTDPQQPSIIEGYRFTREDVTELRWIGLDANGVLGSEWIDQACFDSLNGIVETGDWHALVALAPGNSPVANPCRSN